MSKVHLLFTATLATLTGCDSDLVSNFKDRTSAMCGCADADCAKAEHTKIITSWEEMNLAKIDWSSEQGKKDTKGIEAAVKEYRGCLDEKATASEVTESCQVDDAAKKNSEGCTACCVGQRALRQLVGRSDGGRLRQCPRGRRHQGMHV